MRGVTYALPLSTAKIEISTHTPHARRDNEKRNALCKNYHFNSHASCEA